MPTESALDIQVHAYPTDRERYESQRDQLIRNYERSVENAQFLVTELGKAKRELKELNDKIDQYEIQHSEALERVAKNEEAMITFIKNRNHFQDSYVLHP